MCAFSPLSTERHATDRPGVSRKGSRAEKRIVREASAFVSCLVCKYSLPPGGCFHWLRMSFVAQRLSAGQSRTGFFLFLLPLLLVPNPKSPHQEPAGRSLLRFLLGVLWAQGLHSASRCCERRLCVVCDRGQFHSFACGSVVY